jgi:predicted Zn-dependent protease
MTDAMFSLGALHYQRHDLTKAAEWLRRLLARDPAHTGAHYTLGKIALQLGQIDAAVTHLEQCVRAQPGNKGAHYQLARAYRLQGDGAKADAELAAFRALGADLDDVAPDHSRLERIGPTRARPLPHR